MNSPTRLKLAEGSLPAALRARTARAALAEAKGSRILCTACAHGCTLAEGQVGACGVRFVEGGELRAPYGYIARRYVRSVEVNTIYHLLPGARSLTFGGFGCDLKCPYCHNHRLSQALRDGNDRDPPIERTASSIVDEAIAEEAKVVCAAYNEPMIAAEWVRDVLGEARARGLRTAIVSDGNTTVEALRHVAETSDVYRIDLKGWSAEQYRALGGRIEPVLAAIETARSLGMWVEVVTLVVPGFNDDETGLRSIAKTIAAIDPSIPFHLNAFHPRYRLKETPRMDAMPLISAAGTAYAAGLEFVYVGNVDDQTIELSHTRCPSCRETLVTRWDYQARAVKLVDGACPSCGRRVPGIWKLARDSFASRDSRRPSRHRPGSIVAPPRRDS